MNLHSPAQRPVPVPFWRRGLALGIDALVVGMISSVMGTAVLAQAVVYGLGWLGMRVVLASRNHGQSLGRWAMDMRILDGWGATPTLQDLTKREGFLAIATFLAFWGITHISPTTAWALLLLIPLGVDAVSGWNNKPWGLTLHDRYARTCIVESQRGYSLDRKIQKIVADLRDRMKK